MSIGFVDIHCHILPGLDDGPESVEESIRMLDIAKEDGITDIVASPHIFKGVYENTVSGIMEALEELRPESPGTRLYAGADLRIGRNLVKKIEEGEIPLINDKNYLLLELPTYSIPPLRELENVIHSLKIRGFTPIITHPERNAAILSNMDVMAKLSDFGVAFQLTAMSITGNFGGEVQRASLRMIKERYIHLVASDAHDSVKRPPVLSRAYEVVSKKFGEEAAQRFFISNPLAVINGEEMASG